MYQPEDILECAYIIRLYLADLIGADAMALERELDALLARARAGEKVDNQILEALTRHPTTRKWTRNYVKATDEQANVPEDLRDYSPLPGLPSQIPGSFGGGPDVPASYKFVCPRCGFRWVRRAAGQTPPSCPHHGQKLAQVARTT